MTGSGVIVRHPSGGVKDKQERMKIYYGRLLAAPPVGTAQEAFDLLCRLLDEVEDEHSGKPKDPDPPLKYDNGCIRRSRT